MFARALNVIIQKQCYSDVELNFLNATHVGEKFMVPAIALVRDYRRKGIDFELTQPREPSSRNIFHNANWAHLINDQTYPPTTFEGGHHVPASTFRNQDEQGKAVDGLMSVVLKSISLERKQLNALEWAINEITDNVLNHSQSHMGGVTQASTLSKQDRIYIEFVVADAGIGIKKSLGERSDVRALERAVQEGVTRDTATNQGNGLFGTFQVSTLSKGSFELRSGHGSLIAEENDVRTTRGGALFPGTIVACRIGCDDDALLENALRFKGRVHQLGFDYIEKQYEANGADEFKFKLREECSSFGSREIGKATRVLIENLLKAEAHYRVIVDFEGVVIISSSFADEVFGRLFSALGPTAFMSRVSFQNLDSSVRAVLDRAIAQRLSQVITENAK